MKNKPAISANVKKLTSYKGNSDRLTLKRTQMVTWNHSQTVKPRRSHDSENEDNLVSDIGCRRGKLTRH